MSTSPASQWQRCCDARAPCHAPLQGLLWIPVFCIPTSPGKEPLELCNAINMTHGSHAPPLSVAPASSEDS